MISSIQNEVGKTVEVDDGKQCICPFCGMVWITKLGRTSSGCGFNAEYAAVQGSPSKRNLKILSVCSKSLDPATNEVGQRIQFKDIHDFGCPFCKETCHTNPTRAGNLALSCGLAYRVLSVIGTKQYLIEIVSPCCRSLVKPVQPNTKHKCTCPKSVLFVVGCKCGGV